MVGSTTKMNSRQFLMLGEDPPGLRLELVDGEVAVSPSLRPRHSRVEKRLSFFIIRHLIENDLGELLGDTDTIFGEYDVRRPDLVYFSNKRMHLIHEDEPIGGPPDLCVEIISPSSGTIDREDKFKQYAKAQVPHYWILDPVPQTIEAYKLKGRKYSLAGRGQGKEVVCFVPFPDLELPLGQIWFPSRRSKLQ